MIHDPELRKGEFVVINDLTRGPGDPEVGIVVDTNYFDAQVWCGQFKEDQSGRSEPLLVKVDLHHLKRKD